MSFTPEHLAQAIQKRLPHFKVLFILLSHTRTLLIGQVGKCGPGIYRYLVMHNNMCMYQKLNSRTQDQKGSESLLTSLLVLRMRRHCSRCCVDPQKGLTAKEQSELPLMGGRGDALKTSPKILEKWGSAKAERWTLYGPSESIYGTFEKSHASALISLYLSIYLSLSHFHTLHTHTHTRLSLSLSLLFYATLQPSLGGGGEVNNSCALMIITFAFSLLCVCVCVCVRLRCRTLRTLGRPSLTRGRAASTIPRPGATGNGATTTTSTPWSTVRSQHR